MSDARNSSGNIRGGGSRQTGGSGRTQKNTGTGGNNKGSGILGLGSQTMDKKMMARRNLQMLTMSKKLAIEARKVFLEEYTEEEYIELNVPMPDPDSALKKLKSMSKFTDDWFDQDFRDRWLITVLGVWNEELKAQVDAAIKAKLNNAAAREEWEKKKKARESGETTVNADTEGTPVSTEELEAMLEDVNLDADERKKIKKKLKKRKQKKANKKKTADGDSNNDE